MKAEIIAIGSELLLGQIVDTNSSYIAKCLAENGIELVQTATVGDNLERVQEALLQATTRSPIVITTGGIGPTEDDLTREAVALVAKRPLAFQPHLMEQIEAVFKRHGLQMAEGNQKQAYIPEGSIPIENPKGSAPGFIVEESNRIIISLPGVPSEMKSMMENRIIPFLRQRFDLKSEVIQYKVLRACGLAESALGLQIQDLMKEGQNPSVGTLASTGDIRIRITAKADSPEEASSLIQKVEDEIRKRLGPFIYGTDNETLEGNIAMELERRNLKLSVVEGFTGGILSRKLTNTQNPSFVQGIVLPSDSSQMRFLNLASDEFNSIGKDSKILTDLLAGKAREILGTDYGLATFGKITEERGRGEYLFKTYYSLSTSTGTESQEYPLGGEIGMARERASMIALVILRRILLQLPLSIFG